MNLICFDLVLVVDPVLFVVVVVLKTTTPIQGKTIASLVLVYTCLIVKYLCTNKFVLQYFRSKAVLFFINLLFF